MVARKGRLNRNFQGVNEVLQKVAATAFQKLLIKAETVSAENPLDNRTIPRSPHWRAAVATQKGTRIVTPICKKAFRKHTKNKSEPD